jgi:hypothetical protein
MAIGKKINKKRITHEELRSVGRGLVAYIKQLGERRAFPTNTVHADRCVAMVIYELRKKIEKKTCEFNDSYLMKLNDIEFEALLYVRNDLHIMHDDGEIENALIKLLNMNK